MIWTRFKHDILTEMKKTVLKGIGILGLSVLCFQAQAGNPDRVGQAGASELLINSFGRSSGWGGVHIAGVRGLESMQTNVAGLAFTPKTEAIFTRTNWLVPTGIHINTFGFAQNINDKGVLGLQINSLSFGETSEIYFRLTESAFLQNAHRIRFFSIIATNISNPE